MTFVFYFSTLSACRIFCSVLFSACSPFKYNCVYNLKQTSKQIASSLALWTINCEILRFKFYSIQLGHVVSKLYFIYIAQKWISEQITYLNAGSFSWHPMQFGFQNVLQRKLLIVFFWKIWALNWIRFYLCLLVKNKQTNEQTKKQEASRRRDISLNGWCKISNWLTNLCLHLNVNKTVCMFFSNLNKTKSNFIHKNNYKRGL